MQLAPVKKSFSVEKKKPFKAGKVFNKPHQTFNQITNQDLRKKNPARKFIEQQTTKDFIKKIINQQVRVNLS